MTTEETKEEERILRTMSRKPRTSLSSQSSGSSIPVVYRPASGTNNNQQMIKSSSSSTLVPSISKSKIESSSLTFASSGSSSALPTIVHHSEQIDKLKEQKRTLLGTIVSTRRDLEDVKVEIAKLKQKEDQLVSLMEKREQTVKQLDSQLEELELSEQNDKISAEENRRKLDEERARRVREENERRRKEEEEEERKKKAAEDQRRRKMVVNSPQYVGGLYERQENRPRAATTAAVVKMAPAPIPESEEGLEAEEARLMRAMTRQKPTARPSLGKPASTQVAAAAKAVEPSWKEQDRAREADRNQRLADENRKREDERRVEKEREARAKAEEKNRVTAIQNRNGKKHNFLTAPLFNFNFDTQVVSICGDFTDWKEISMTGELDKNFQYSMSLPLSSGVHFYRFKVGGKWEVNKNCPTGVAPTGELMNKVEV